MHHSFISLATLLLFAGLAAAQTKITLPTQAKGRLPSANLPVTIPLGNLPTQTGTGSIAMSTWAAMNNSTLNNIVFAERQAGSDASCKIQAAINATPTNGGVVDARNLSDVSGVGGCSIDPGTKTITLLLGPRNYFFSRVTLRGGLEIRGFGTPGGSPDSVGSGTTITSTNTTGELFSLSPYNSHSSTHVFLHGFGVFGPGNTTGCTAQVPSATTDAFKLDANLGPVSSLQYSRFDDIFICGFSGNGIYFKGNAGGGGTHQFNTFTAMTVFRAAGGNSALRIEGSAYQFHFINSEFDANCFNICIDSSSNPNIFLGGVSGGSTASYPYIIKFDGLTTQGAKVHVQLDGVRNVSFLHPHHEQGCVGYDITYAANGVNLPTDNVTIKDASFNGNVGVGTAGTSPTGTCGGGGTGAVLRTSTANARNIVIANSFYASGNTTNVPDNLGLCTAGAEVSFADNDMLAVGKWNGSQQAGAIATSGCTLVDASATAINTGGAHFVALTGTTPIQTINGSLGPGETITFGVNAAPGASLAAGGNLSLGGHPGIWLNLGDTATFIRNDALTGNWQLLSMSMGPDGGMSKTVHGVAGCATSASAGAVCTTVVNWTTAFPDTAYNARCTGAVFTSGVPLNGGLTAKAVGSVTFQTVAATAAAAQYTNIECVAVHD